MAGKIVAGLLLFFGGAITLYVLYKALIGALQPVVQKKIYQKMQKDNLNQLQNNLQLHNQQDQQTFEAIQKKTKS